MEDFLLKNLGVQCCKRANAQEYFYDKLSDESDPELKRKIIGKAFIEIFDQEAKKIKDIQVFRTRYYLSRYY